MNRSIFIAALLLIPVLCFSQKKYQEYEGREFLRQVKLTKEYLAATARADSANLDTDKVPQNVKFVIVREQELGTDPDRLVGKLTRKLAIGIELEQYTILYDRNLKRIVSIKGGINANVQLGK